FFIPAATQQWLLQPGLFSDADNILGPTFSTPGRMGLVTDTDTIPAATVILGALQPPLVADADIFYIPFVNVLALLPSAIVDFAVTFYAPTFNPTQTLLPTIWVDVDDHLIPALIEGQPPLQPALLADSDTILPWPSVAVGPVTLTPSLFADAESFYA